MGDIKITVPDDVEEQFRRRAMEAFGHRRGALSEAGAEALAQWAEERAAEEATVVLSEDPVDAIDGVLGDLDAGSVELQERVGRVKRERYRRDRGVDPNADRAPGPDSSTDRNRDREHRRRNDEDDAD